MPATLLRDIQNVLLAALPAHDLDVLGRGLEAVELPRRTQIHEPNREIEYAYFLETGIASIVSTSDNGKEMQIGIIGREGMIGTAVLHLTDRSPYAVCLQVEGVAHRIRAELLRDAMEKSQECRRVLYAFAQSFLIQTAETALSNAHATMVQRLARCLLMIQDRVRAHEIPLTHEYLSILMGARRPSVTEASRELSRRGMIATKYGKLRILDRAGLRESAGEFYGVPEKELMRLVTAS